jgi:hypothetical protein
MTTPIPPTASRHLASHELNRAPTSNEETVELLIDGEDDGCAQCASILDRYLSLVEQQDRCAECARSYGPNYAGTCEH